MSIISMPYSDKARDEHERIYEHICRCECGWSGMTPVEYVKTMLSFPDGINASAKPYLEPYWCCPKCKKELQYRFACECGWYEFFITKHRVINCPSCGYREAHQVWDIICETEQLERWPHVFRSIPQWQLAVFRRVTHRRERLVREDSGLYRGKQMEASK